MTPEPIPTIAEMTEAADRITRLGQIVRDGNLAYTGDTANDLMRAAGAVDFLVRQADVAAVLAGHDPDEPESETGARDVAEKARHLIDQDVRYGRGGVAARSTVIDLAGLVEQLAACVTCHIEDNERIPAKVNELVLRVESLEGRTSAIEEEAENLNARDRLAALEDERSDEVETRSPEWQEAYDQGWTAALAARDAEDAHAAHLSITAGCAACAAEAAEDEPDLADAGAVLDRIARLLDGREWTGEDIEIVAQIVRATGRQIGDPK